MHTRVGGDLYQNGTAYHEIPAPTENLATVTIQIGNIQFYSVFNRQHSNIDQRSTTTLRYFQQSRTYSSNHIPRS